MIISPRVVAAGLSPFDEFEVLHMGAHNAEESDRYTQWGAKTVHWVEPIRSYERDALEWYSLVPGAYARGKRPNVAFSAKRLREDEWNSPHH